MISNSIDGHRRQKLTASALGKLTAPAMDVDVKRGAAAGLLHRHVEERRVALLACVSNRAGHRLLVSRASAASRAARQGSTARSPSGWPPSSLA